MTTFTDVIERCLCVDRSVIRGRCIRVSPDDWCIAGQPASMLRAGEIAARDESVRHP